MKQLYQVTIKAEKTYRIIADNVKEATETAYELIGEELTEDGFTYMSVKEDVMKIPKCFYTTAEKEELETDN